MKTIIVVIFCYFLASYTHAQQVAPVYFNGDKITTDKTKATSYAIYGKLSDGSLFIFKRYDLYNNLIQTGFYKDEQLTVPEGKFIFYDDVEDFNYEHGTSFRIRDKSRYVSQQGNFENGLENGEWKVFYPDGKILSLRHFVNGKLHGEFILYNRFGVATMKGTYVNGKADGEWIDFSKKKKMTFEHGVLKSTRAIEKNN